MTKSILAAFAAILCFCSTSSTAQTLHATLVRALPSHHEAGRDVAFSPDSRILASAGVDSIVHLWSIPDGRLIASLKHPIGVTAIAFTPDGKSLVTAAYDAKLRIWNLDTRAVTRTLAGHTGTIWSVDVSSDGQLLASSG